MRNAVTVASLLWLALAQAQHEVHSEGDHTNANEVNSSSNVAAINIMINPEARISVSRGTLPLPAVACGHTMQLPVKISNQGFVTAPLQVTLVNSIPEGVDLKFTSESLKGISEEIRILKVTLTKPEPVDITLSFRAENDIPDLGGGNRIHLMLRCK
jgi:uncharacterized membrane protein